MYKQHLINSIEKEINICRRLYTKILPDQMDFRPKEGIRSTLELLQYLSVIIEAMPKYWLEKHDMDFSIFYTSTMNASKEIPHEEFMNAMEKQMDRIKTLFNQINEEDLLQREIEYPWGGKAALGEAIIATSIKWATAYKLQLFLFIKLSQDTSLSTGDAWMLTEI